MHRYVNEMCTRHNMRPLWHRDRMEKVAGYMKGVRTTYKKMIEDVGLASYARPVAK